MIGLIVFGGAFLAVTVLFVVTARRLMRVTHQLETITENRNHWRDRAEEWCEVALPFLKEREQQFSEKIIAGMRTALESPTVLPENVFMEAAE